MQDALKLKENIVGIIRRRGPCLPIHISSEIKINTLFASAFLSELFSEKRIKISNMKVGSSPLYFIPGQEPMLEKFANHLKSKEKDAFFLLKEKSFLKDTEQEPAIRVALRYIRDFAIPFRNNGEIYWKYLTAPDSEFKPREEEKERIEEKKIEPEIKAEVKIEQPIKEIQEEIAPKKIDIFEKNKPKKQPKKKPTKSKPAEKKQNDKFFNRIKESLLKKSVEILDIEDFSKNEIILKVKIEGIEHILFAYNKKRIDEEDIVKAYKKASQLNLPYEILSLGEPQKKLDNLIKAVKTLGKIGKIE